MKQNTWLWIIAGLGAYYLLKSSQPVNPNQITFIDPLTGKPYVAPPWQSQMPPSWQGQTATVNPYDRMYANPLADPCNGNSPVYSLEQCQAQGRQGYYAGQTPGLIL